MTSGIIDVAALGIVEEKYEPGTDGDFTVQGGCSYQAYWVSEDVGALMTYRSPY